MALQDARAAQMTSDFRAEYAARNGIEGTQSREVHNSNLRRSRRRGLQKTHTQHLFIAMGTNIARLGNHLAGSPVAKTRHAAFIALYDLPVAA